jgi:alpha-D-ribose 1-methylphosphonate 5-triphosphate synthase subunit PhnH
VQRFIKMPEFWNKPSILSIADQECLLSYASYDLWIWLRPSLLHWVEVVSHTFFHSSSPFVLSHPGESGSRPVQGSCFG